ncbi:MAG TPA: TonB-dependent receptor [Steroidobacteraceae bacterium]|nr:TonB-dependent receptor [Steroidobacteraceae bacterium]
MSQGLSERRAPACAAILLVSWVPAAWCQQLLPPSASAPPEQLQQVIVTAARAPEPADESFFSVTVLTRADIEARQAPSVQDLLADLAGINIDNSGGLGQQSSVFIRGADSDHTLLLVDGVRVGSATLGIAPFEIIPLEQIDHIEVVRGPRSTLYGSDAVGGVVQIFTRQAGEPGVTWGGSAMTGSYDTHEFTGYVAARGREAWGSISGDVLTTAGIAACLPSAIAGCFDPGAPQVPDGHQNRSASLNGGVRLTDQLTASADVLYTHGWTAFDGAGFDDRLDFEEKVFSAHLEQALGGNWHLKLMAGRDEDDERDFLDPTPVGTFDTVRSSASLQADGRLGSAVCLVSGVDYEDVHVDSDTPYEVTSRTTRAVFAELHADLAGWSALAGARFEDNEQFGDHWTENLGLTRTLSPGLRLVLTWGTAFRAPTFDELYFPGFGNPDLKPETSQSYEAGLDGEQGALRWSLHAYQTTIDDEISIDPLTFLPVNIHKSRIRGVELQGDWHNADWVLAGQLTGLEPLNISPGEEYGNLLPRRAEQSASVNVRRLLRSAPSDGADGSVGVVARWQGRRYDDLANTLPMGGYLTVDLLTDWRLAASWRLEAKVANLFDRSYQTAAYYAQPGRSYGVTIRYRSSLH